MGRFKRRKDADGGDVTWSVAPTPVSGDGWEDTWRPSLWAQAPDPADGVWHPVSRERADDTWRPAPEPAAPVVLVSVADRPVADAVAVSPPASVAPVMDALAVDPAPQLKGGDSGFDVWQRAAPKAADTGLPPSALAGGPLDDTVPSGLPALTAAALAPAASGPAAPAPATRAARPQAVARTGAGHRGRLRLVRRPLTLAVLAAGLAAAVGGTVGLSRLTGHHGQVARPLAAPSAAPTGPFAAPPPRHAEHRASPPVALDIPTIGVRTQLTHLGRTPQGTLQVPTSTSVAGWYTGSPRPGEIGSAVIAGHIDSTAGPGVFFRLRLLRPGSLIYVRRANRSLAVFRVYAEHMYVKTHFPTQQVYGPEPDAELHLITCGGVFDVATGSYLSNVVVYATEIHHRPPPHRRHGGQRAHHPRSRHS